jgi:hypothetical protein
MHRLQDVDDITRASVVEHLERPARVTAAERHRDIDVGGAGITVLEHPDRVVELRVGEGCGEESRAVPGGDRVQAEPGRERGRLGSRVRRGHIGQDQLSEPLLADKRFDEVDTDHIGRVARGQGRVQDPVPRVRRHDDQARLG